MVLDNLPFPLPITGSGNLVVVTGWRNVGKTRYCEQVIDAYRAAGLKVSGLLSPGRFNGQKKNGFLPSI